MSETTTTAPQAAAPEKPKKVSPFANLKKPETIVYQLVERNNMALRSDTPEFPPLIIKKNRDVINYKLEKDIEGIGKKDDVVQLPIRYIRGEKSIFVHEQEAHGRVIPVDILTNQNNNIEIISGNIRVQPTEKTKIQFLDYVSWNIDSPYKSGNVKCIIHKLSEEESAKVELARMKKQKEAEDKAFAADEYFVAEHAKMLGIPLVNQATGGGRTFEAVQAEYLKKATNEPDIFLSTFKEVKV